MHSKEDMNAKKIVNSRYIKYMANREGIAIPENKREIDHEFFMDYHDSRLQSHVL